MLVPVVVTFSPEIEKRASKQRAPLVLMAKGKKGRGLHASYGYIQIGQKGFRATVGNNNNKWHHLKVHFVCSSRQVKVKAEPQLRRLRCQLHLHLHLGLLHIGIGAGAQRAVVTTLRCSYILQQSERQRERRRGRGGRQRGCSLARRLLQLMLTANERQRQRSPSSLGHSASCLLPLQNQFVARPRRRRLPRSILADFTFLQRSF